MSLVFNKRDPIYLQVIEDFKQKIASGSLKPGEEVPSRRELATELKINPNTVQRAYKEMEEEKLLHTEGNMPSRITEDTNVLKKLRHQMIQHAVRGFVDQIEQLHIPQEEVYEILGHEMKRLNSKGGVRND